jgi:hypothetical protein
MLQSYINLLQGAFTELEECRDPYSECKKVDSFVVGLHSEHLKLVHQGIITNEKTCNDFQEAYAFAQTMECFNMASLMKGDSSFDREISSVETGGSKGKVDTSYHSYTEWCTLPVDERKKILVAQEKNGGHSKNEKKMNNGKGKSKGSGNSFVDEKTKQKLAALVSQLVDVLDDNDREGGGSGNGDHGNGAKKKKSAVESSPADQFGHHKNASSVLQKASKSWEARKMNDWWWTPMTVKKNAKCFQCAFKG